jgi:MarR family transcriptional regulator, organic hydroperoxide resistance regulator
MTQQRDVFRTLGNTVRTVRARVDRSLQQTGLRLGQFQVLRHLWETDGLTPREIAARLDVEMPTVTRTVQRMIRDGLVRREAHQSDARSVRIYLTKRGTELQPMLDELIEQETERAMRGFDEEDRQALIEMLDRISENTRE